MIAIVDYGMGNVRSAQMALEHVGADVELTGDAARIRSAEAVVLPGVGAFPKAMSELERRGLVDVVGEAATSKPLLGICLGMQLLFDSSTEMGGGQGLGLLEGPVRELDAGGLKVPQIGWNEVAWRMQSPLVEGLAERTPMYHVHSFAPRPADPSVVLGTATYGSEFVTAVGRDNVFGVQFHPEKSSTHGLELLHNFVRLSAHVAA